MSTHRTALPLSSHLCGGESLSVERILGDIEGVVTVLVNPVSEMAYVEYDPALTDPVALFAALKRAGFAAEDRVSVRGSRPATHGDQPYWRG